MQIVNILLVLTGILTLLSGIVVFAGSPKNKKGAASAYLLAVIGAAAWSLSMSVFLSSSPEQYSQAKICLLVMYISVLFDTSMLFLYTGWKRRATWLVAGIIIMLMVWLSVSLAVDPSRLFAEINLDKINGNSVVFANSFYMLAYMAICSLSVLAFIVGGAITVKKTRSKDEKQGAKILLFGISIAGILGGIFDLALPLLGNYSLIWVGPVATSVAVLFYYYAILRYRLVSLGSKWLKIFSYVTLLAVIATIYFGLFFVFFGAIFRSASPSVEIIILNFLMIVAVLILTPAIGEISAFARSLLNTNQIDLNYVSKKLIAMLGQKASPADLASFLSSYLHFGYVGILIGGKLYSSTPVDLTAVEIEKIAALGKAEQGVWQHLTVPVKQAADRLDLKAVAELRDEEGTTLGQLILGSPQGRRNLDKKDYRELSVVVALVSAVLASKR